MEYIVRRQGFLKVALQTVRHAGGGGRPGKKPTFNWKEKKILGLDKPRMKSFKEALKPSGDFEDIEPFFDEKSGDMMIDITNLENFEPPVPGTLEEQFNDKKKVRISTLFGSKKPSGMIEYKKKENHFKFRFRNHSEQSQSNTDSGDESISGGVSASSSSK